MALFFVFIVLLKFDQNYIFRKLKHISAWKGLNQKNTFQTKEDLFIP
jgi:hypothetical protein